MDPVDLRELRARVQHLEDRVEELRREGRDLRDELARVAVEAGASSLARPTLTSKVELVLRDSEDPLGAHEVARRAGSKNVRSVRGILNRLRHRGHAVMRDGGWVGMAAGSGSEDDSVSKPSCPRCSGPAILLGASEASRVRSSRYRCGSCRHRFRLRDGHEAHKVADCQARDGSVLVEWQGCDVEGTVEAEEGAYASLADALRLHPDAIPVCPCCSCDGPARDPHRPDCERHSQVSVESFVERDA